MINETKKRDASPLDHLGGPGMARRIAKVSTGAKTVDSSAPIKGVPKPKETAVEVVREPSDRTKSKRGRPSTSGKPWEALGISRQAYYKRQKKAAK